MYMSKTAGCGALAEKYLFHISNLKFPPILFVNSSEIRMLKSPDECQILNELILLDDNIFYKKFTNDVFVSHYQYIYCKMQYDFETQFTFTSESCM